MRSLVILVGVTDEGLGNRNFTSGTGVRFFIAFKAAPHNGYLIYTEMKLSCVGLVSWCRAWAS
jgi:hypothetical protein